MNVEREMERFIRQQAFRARESEFQGFVLKHAAENSKGSEVESWSLPDNFTGDDVKPMVEEIVARAQTDADGLGGVNRYVLHAMVKGEKQSAGRFVFKMRADDEDELNGQTGEEGANATGLLKQLMRHNDSMAKTVYNMANAISGTLARRLESSDRQVEKLIVQRHDDMELMEQLYTRKHEREMEMLQLEGSETRKAQLMEKVHLLLPALVNKLAGGKALIADSPMLVMLQELFKSIRPEQFQQLQQVFSPDQMIVLVQMLQAYQAGEEAKGKSKELEGGKQ